MGADIGVKGDTAIVRGVESLDGAAVRATDLRAGAALILAGLAAKGDSCVEEVDHVLRGSESIDLKLSSLGAQVSFESVSEK
jgi:UDP-N-acetylglucosamine 1-carboxyvinyltransferase